MGATVAKTCLTIATILNQTFAQSGKMCSVLCFVFLSLYYCSNDSIYKTLRKDSKDSFTKSTNYEQYLTQ